MNSLRFATSEALLGWLKTLAASHRVLAPRQEGTSVVFRALGADMMKDIAPLLKRSTASPKAALLPASEVLVQFHSTKDPEDLGKLNTTLEARCEATPTVLFGGRPCDARGFAVLDRPYMEGPYKDPYYIARREATLVVTQACPTSFSTCFCHWVDSGPADSTGSDIVFTAVDKGFALAAFTEKGEKALAAFAESPDQESLRGQVEAVHAKARESLGPDSELPDIPARVAARFNDEAFWIAQTAKCLSCGACTYLCPTCQCFTITDEGNALNGKRLRSWDTCMSPLFTREASGHNPRAEKFKRMRNRISHKFSYYPNSYNGVFSCCGCGRCISSCPVSLDIRHIVREAVLSAPAVSPAAPSPAKTAPATPSPEPAPAHTPAPASAPAPAETQEKAQVEASKNTTVAQAGLAQSTPSRTVPQQGKKNTAKSGKSKSSGTR